MGYIYMGMYLFFIGLVLAYLEVQIEGENGWAARLPTWRLTKKWWMKFSGGKPLTGYHIALTVFILLLLHWPALWTRWTWPKEALIMSQYLVLSFFWDFLWFVVNPRYGLKKYNRKHVWWFKKWLLGVPVEYWMALAGSFLLAWLADRINPWLAMTGMIIGLTVIAAAVGEIVRASSSKKRWWNKR